MLFVKLFPLQTDKLWAIYKIHRSADTCRCYQLLIGLGASYVSTKTSYEREYMDGFVKNVN